MSPVLPSDILELIIDIVGENKDIDLLEKLALVSHLFLPICRKHLFAAVDLYDLGPMRTTSSKQGFIKLVNNNPDIVKYIRRLTYNLSYSGDLFLKSPILPNFLRTIFQLECLTITSAPMFDWNTQDSSIKSALLFLMHLPTINHIELASITNFPLSALTPCLNLNWLDISWVEFVMPLDSHPESTYLEVPRIHRFTIWNSTLATKGLLHAKRQDGQPAFNFRDLKQLTMDVEKFENVQNVRYLLQNSERLEVLRMENNIKSLAGLLYPSARSLKFLHLRVPLGDELPTPLAGLCEELEAMAGHSILEALELQVAVKGHETENTIGLIVQQLEEVLVNPEWSTLKQVSLEISIAFSSVLGQLSARLRDALQFLPEKYLNRLSNIESITFNYSAYIADYNGLPLLKH